MSVRYIGTVGQTSTYKVVDDKIEGGEAAVISVHDGGDHYTINCLACGGYKCQHARAVSEHIGELLSSPWDGTPKKRWGSKR